MHILKYQDAVYQTYLVNADCWEWRDIEGLRYVILQPRPGRDEEPSSELQLNDECLWQKQGLHSLEYAWLDISCILLEHNIFCEPIEPIEQLALPNIQETYDHG